MKTEALIAVRFLFSKKGRFLSIATGVAVVSLGLSVAALFTALSVVTGFQKEYRRAILNFNSHVIVMGLEEGEDTDNLEEALSEDSLQSALLDSVPFLYREGLVVTKEQTRGIVFKGVDFKQYASLSKIVFHEQGTLTEKSQPTRVFLGKTLFEELNPYEKDLRVLFPPQAVRKVSVAGLFAAGLYEYDANFALLDLKAAQNFFKTGDKVSGWEIWLKDPDQAEAWAETLREKLEFPYIVTTWRQLNENIFRALEVEKILFGILLLVLVALSSLSVLGSLVMLFLGKKEEVSLLRALGFSARRLRKVFILDGLLIGFAGILLGLVLGSALLFILKTWQPITLAPEVYFIRQIPVVWSGASVAWVAFSAFLIVFLTSELAARRIACAPLSRC